MKKTNFLKIVLVVMVIALSVLALVACGEDAQLSTPTNISYDGATLSWNKVDGATAYKVQINNGNEYTVTAPKYAFNASGTEFTASVWAITSDDSVKDSEMASTNFSPLATIGSVRFDANGVASWDVIEGATAYVVRIDGVANPNILSDISILS